MKSTAKHNDGVNMDRTRNLALLATMILLSFLSGENHAIQDNFQSQFGRRAGDGTATDYISATGKQMPAGPSAWSFIRCADSSFHLTSAIFLLSVLSALCLLRFRYLHASANPN